MVELADKLESGIQLGELGHLVGGWVYPTQEPTRATYQVLRSTKSELRSWPRYARKAPHRRAQGVAQAKKLSAPRGLADVPKP